MTPPGPFERLTFRLRFLPLVSSRLWAPPLVRWSCEARRVSCEDAITDNDCKKKKEKKLISDNEPPWVDAVTAALFYLFIFFGKTFWILASFFQVQAPLAAAGCSVSCASKFFSPPSSHPKLKSVRVLGHAPFILLWLLQPSVYCFFVLPSSPTLT